VVLLAGTSKKAPFEKGAFTLKVSIAYTWFLTGTGDAITQKN
jgi:hypothetical protein